MSGSIRIVEMPDLGVVNDSSSVVGERAGSGRFTAPALRTYIADALADTTVANVRDYGAKGDGSTDDTAAIQAAITTGKQVRIPAGNYRITSQINCNTHGQAIRGAGRQATFIRVTGPSAGFSAGIFHVSNPSGPGGGSDSCAYFSDFTVALAQPDTSVRGSLNNYPAIFNLDTAPRCQFENVRMVGGLVGLSVNVSGGLRCFACDFGCYSQNIFMDGGADVTAFTDCEIWPFTDTGIMTNNQMAIFADANCFGIYSLRNDYFSWTGGLILCGRAAYFGTGTRTDLPGSTYGWFSGTGFDTFGGLEVVSGNIVATNCVFSVGGTLLGTTHPKNCVRHLGGMLTITGSWFLVGGYPVDNDALIYSAPTTGSTMLTINGCNFTMGTEDLRAIYVAPTATRDFNLTFTNNTVGRLGTGAYTKAMIEINGGSGVVSGNTALQFSGATGTLSMISIGSGAGPYTLSGNAPNGWQVYVAGSSVTAASLITIPDVFGDGIPIIDVGGTTPIGTMTYAVIGVPQPFSGGIVTLNFAAVLTVNSGTYGAAGQFLLNGRTNFTTAAGSSLTVRLNHVGNWVEIGRCA
jgi:hypothetical protein